jgi:hypothetical protein
MKDIPHAPVEAEVANAELLALLDREVSRLPDKYRTPVILCELEGRTRQEAAQQLRLPEGTLSSRLATARKMLARRLARHGLTLAAGALAAGRSASAASACLPAALVATTVKAATRGAAGRTAMASATSANVAALTERVVRAMFLTRLKKVAMVLVVAGLLMSAWAALTEGRPSARNEARGDPAVQTQERTPEPKKNQPEDPENAIYAYHAVGETEGRRIQRNDGGGEAVLGQLLGRAFGKATLRSVANDNSRFVLDLKNAGPLAKEAGQTHMAVVIDGVCMPVYGHSDPHPDGTIDLSCMIHGESAARKVEGHLRIRALRRKHPGHRFEVRWSPEKESYSIGEAVTLKMEIRNVGDVPFAFFDGGQQRGPRNNQFKFLAFHGVGHGKAVPDTGDPTNMGGIASLKTLLPGQTFTKSVVLDKWFAFTEADTYRITGMFEMELHPPEQGSSPAIWDDVAVGACSVRMVVKNQ